MPDINTQLTRLLTGRTTDGSGEAFNAPRGVPDRLYCAQISGSGAVSATVTFEGSCDGVTWLPIATGLSLSGTDSDADSAAVTAPWPLVRATVASLTGTGAAVDAFIAI